VVRIVGGLQPLDGPLIVAQAARILSRGISVISGEMG
jgi:hypothetical protein